jgi:nicotinamidase-related amidase
MKTALLVIDVQRGLFDLEPRPFEADAVIQRINRLARSARAASTPVVFIQHECPGSPLEYHSELWSLAADLVSEPDDLFVRKTTPDSFLHTPLHDLLQTNGIGHLVICGYACEYCVDTTTRRAAALGYDVTLVSDGHTTQDKPHATAASIRAHENATLPELSSFGPVISAVPAAQVLFSDPRQG